ncbi:TPA: hypothetical protein ACSP21_002114 [Aeromonas veronii]|uniref:hypothetical protein n=1 Tax=Aeromonas veronii TaxID=654 RepID=UPI0038EF32CC
MQVNELYELTDWINKEIKNKQLLPLYQTLTSILQQNTYNQSRQPFENERKTLIDAISSVDVSRLTYAQENMLKQLEIYDFICSHGVDNINDILYKNSLDISTAYSRLDQISKSIESGINKSDQMHAILKGLLVVNEVNSDENNSDDVIIRVHFQRDVSFANVSDFKKWGQVWWEIGRGISMVHNACPEDIKVVGAQKGSIIIELATLAVIATTASKIILSALSIAERVLAIKKQIEEIKALKLTNQKLEQELEKEIDISKQNGLKNIKDDLINELKIQQDGDGEKIKVLEKAVKNLIEFVEHGGEVDFVSKDQNDNNPDIQQLKMNFSEIKRIEKKILGIEQK